MRGHIRRRGEAGRWEYIIDVGMAAAQRCQDCGRRYWMERKAKAACPKCGGSLIEADERRRKTQGGFATRKEAEEAMAKVMTAVAEQSYVVPSRVTLREFLLKEWLPAIKGTVRPTTHASYTMHCKDHIVPALGVLQLSRISAQAINTLYAKLLLDGRVNGHGPEGCRALAALGAQPGRCRRPTPGCEQAARPAGLELRAAGRLSGPRQG
jgi:predicted RNA-binding Zn-ribbon protein involved in translation (DUF1610 family)